MYGIAGSQRLKYPVETGEAEWILQILGEMLLFYFCQQAISKARRDALNKKLKDAGKKPML
jgi:hypothetical protein